MKNKFLFSILIISILLSIQIISAVDVTIDSEPQTCQLNKLCNILIACESDSQNGACSSNTAINLTLFNPGGGTPIFVNASMQNQGSFFNYSFIPGATGDYPLIASARDSVGGDVITGILKVTGSGFASTSTFFFIYLIILALIFIIGYAREDKWIMALGSILVIILGFFVIRNGVDVIKDTQTTWAIGIIIWGLGLYFLYLSVEEQLKEWR